MLTVQCMSICPCFNKLVTNRGVGTMEGLLHVGHVWPGIVPQQGVHGHDNARRAEPTLGAVSLRYSLLQQTHAGTREAEKTSKHVPRSGDLLPSSGQEKRFLLPSARMVLGVFWCLCFTCTGCSFLATLPMPSTVTTATRCSEQMGARQALMA